MTLPKVHPKYWRRDPGRVEIKPGEQLGEVTTQEATARHPIWFVACARGHVTLKDIRDARRTIAKGQKVHCTECRKLARQQVSP